jgi:predicted cobalt transporter CbtA
MACLISSGLKRVAQRSMKWLATVAFTGNGCVSLVMHYSNLKVLTF